MKDLHDKSFASETDYLQQKQERIQQTQDLAAERYRLVQLAAVKEEVKQQKKAFSAQARSTQLVALADV